MEIFLLPAAEAEVSNTGASSFGKRPATASGAMYRGSEACPHPAIRGIAYCRWAGHACAAIRKRMNIRTAPTAVSALLWLHPWACWSTKARSCAAVYWSGAVPSSASSCRSTRAYWASVPAPVPRCCRIQC